MNNRITIALFALLGLASCTKPRQAAPNQSGPKLEACSLITTDEVGAIQKATITEAKSSDTSDGLYLISLCYYNAREPNMSVSVALTQPDPRVADSNPRDYWKKTFGRFSGKGEAEEQEKAERDKLEPNKKEEEERASPPQRIEGLGEEAFWAGNRVGGALYVLEKNFILRISAGGAEDGETKIRKSKTLAEKAIGHL